MSKVILLILGLPIFLWTSHVEAHELGHYIVDESDFSQATMTFVRERRIQWLSNYTEEKSHPNQRCPFTDQIVKGIFQKIVVSNYLETFLIIRPVHVFVLCGNPHSQSYSQYGVIWMDGGNLLTLANTDQLAWVIAHELAHHLTLNDANLLEPTKYPAYAKTSEEARIKLESLADQIALELIDRAGFSTSAALPLLRSFGDDLTHKNRIATSKNEILFHHYPQRNVGPSLNVLRNEILTLLDSKI